MKPRTRTEAALTAAIPVIALVMMFATTLPVLAGLAVAVGPLWLYYLAGAVRAEIGYRTLTRARAKEAARCRR